MNPLPKSHPLYAKLAKLLFIKRGLRWTDAELAAAAKTFGIDRSKLAAAAGMVPEKLTTPRARLEWVERLQHELRLLDTGLKPRDAHWIAHERDRGP